MKPKWHFTPDFPKNESELIQMIRMRKSIRQKWVKTIIIRFTLFISWKVSFYDKELECIAWYIKCLQKAI